MASPKHARKLTVYNEDNPNTIQNHTDNNEVEDLASSTVSGEEEWNAGTINALSDRKRKFVHTTPSQRRAMMEWLEKPMNFQLLTAPPGTTVITNAMGKRMKKTDGFRSLMTHVNTTTGSKWTMEITKSRFESFKITYKKAKKLRTESEKTSSGYAAHADIDQKVYTMCNFYDRLDALFDPAPSQPTDSSDVNFNRSDLKVENVDSDKSHAPVVVTKSPKSFSSTTPPSTLLTHNETSNTFSDDLAQQQLVMEREKLNVLQAQLVMKARELELKEREMALQETQYYDAIRVELIGKLAEAGKSTSEIQEIMSIMNSVQKPRVEN